MTHHKLCLTICIITIIIAVTVNAKDIYKWVDENGTLHFQGSPPQNTEQPVTIKRLPTYEDYYRDSQPPGTEQDRENTVAPSPSTTREVSKAPEVELYVTSWCPHCKRALDFLRSRGIPFDAYDIEKDKNAARRKARLTRESEVPFAIINGKAVQGFSQRAYERALQTPP